MSQKTFSIYGDSISTFQGVTPSGNRVYYTEEQLDTTGVRTPEDTWWAQVIDHFGGTLLANAAYSGCLVEGEGFPSGECRAEQVLGADAQAPDVIIIFMGINDYGWAGVDAQVAARSEAMPQNPRLVASIPESIAGEAASDALQRFSDAYRLRMLPRLREVAPQADIWCVTLLPGRVQGRSCPGFCYQIRGIDIKRYNDAIRQAARENGCNIADIASFGFDYETTDGTHPTTRGMQQIARLIVAAMSNTPEVVSQDENLFPPVLRSSRTCEKTTCIGCEFAESTGNQWSLVCNKFTGASQDGGCTC